jgi:hypothetical protein
MYRLYLGDKEEEDVLGWLIENIGPLGLTTKADFNYYNTYYGTDATWMMDTSDVSDVSGQFDTITQVCFTHKEDAVLCSLRFGGTIH